MDLSMATNYLYWFILIVLALLLFACMIRAVLGPRVADRLVASNMIGTIVIVIIAILSFVLNESYLLDICIIYSMISFLAVAMLSKIYIGIAKEKKNREEKDRDAQ